MTEIITATSLNGQITQTVTDVLKDLLDKHVPLKTNSFIEHKSNTNASSDELTQHI